MSSGGGRTIHVDGTLDVDRSQCDRFTGVDKLDRIGLRHYPGHAPSLAGQRVVIQRIPRSPSGDCRLGERQLSHLRLEAGEKLRRGAPYSEDALFLAGRIHQLGGVVEAACELPPQHEVTAVGEHHGVSQHEIVLAPGQEPADRQPIADSEHIFTCTRALEEIDARGFHGPQLLLTGIVRDAQLPDGVWVPPLEADQLALYLHELLRVIDGMMMVGQSKEWDHKGPDHGRQCQPPAYGSHDFLPSMSMFLSNVKYTPLAMDRGSHPCSLFGQRDLEPDCSQSLGRLADAPRIGCRVTAWRPKPAVRLISCRQAAADPKQPLVNSLLPLIKTYPG